MKEKIRKWARERERERERERGRWKGGEREREEMEREGEKWRLEKGNCVCLTSRYLGNSHQTLPLPLARIAQNTAATVDPNLGSVHQVPITAG